MHNIYLIGFMGSGKSAVAKKLCAEGGYRRREMDEEIEEKEGKSIPDIFIESGETYFRDRETELLREICNEEYQVVSCGGGVILRDENRRMMKDSGTIVWLTASPETILERVRYDNRRPLLRGKKTVMDIGEMMEARRPGYETAADIRVDTDGRPLQDVSAEIIQKTGV